ncbi:MAG: hypothetical protein NVSMB46_04940 [Candidatus Saccharimonadales bacterium]
MIQYIIMKPEHSPVTEQAILESYYHELGTRGPIPPEVAKDLGYTSDDQLKDILNNLETNSAKHVQTAKNIGQIICGDCGLTPPACVHIRYDKNNKPYTVD